MVGHNGGPLQACHMPYITDGHAVEKGKSQGSLLHWHVYVQVVVSYAAALS